MVANLPAISCLVLNAATTKIIGFTISFFGVAGHSNAVFKVLSRRTQRAVEWAGYRGMIWLFQAKLPFLFALRFGFIKLNLPTPKYVT